MVAVRGVWGIVSFSEKSDVVMVESLLFAREAAFSCLMMNNGMILCCNVADRWYYN